MTVYLLEAITPENGARLVVAVYAHAADAQAHLDRLMRPGWSDDGRTELLSPAAILGVIATVTSYPIVGQP